MRARFFRALAGAALFLAGYGMQQDRVSPFSGIDDPRFLGLLLELLGLVLLLSPILGRGRRLPDVQPPRIRRELLYKPPCCDDEPKTAAKEAPAADSPDPERPDPNRPDRAD